MKHAITIDVENWYHAENMRPVAPVAAWPSLPSRIEANTHKVLDLCDTHGVKGTYFVLGSAAERAPGLVLEIAARGHEVACHGWSHELVYRQTPEVFADETRRAKALLEDLSGQAVRGYRASTFSITEKSRWALDILAEQGFDYDSSIAPVVHDRYGIPSLPKDPHRIPLADGRSIVEFPVSFGKKLGKRFPLGGGFFRLFSLRWAKATLRAHEAEERPASIYLHPWEFDPEQPRQKGLGLSRTFRHYARLHTTHPKLDALMNEFLFTTMADVLGDLLAASPEAVAR